MCMHSCLKGILDVCMRMYKESVNKLVECIYLMDGDVGCMEDVE